MQSIADVTAAATEDAVSRWGAASEVGPDEVVVVALAPHKVGPPRVPDDRVKYWPGQQYVTSRESALYAEARGLVHIPGIHTYDWWGAPKRVLSPFAEEGSPFTSEQQPGALRIAQGVDYDPGSAVYRFHSAINAASKHSSMFARWADTNPHSSFRQWDGEKDAGIVRAAVETADVLHNHVGYWLLNNTGLAQKEGQLLVVHLHGSRPDGRPLAGDPLSGTGMSHIEWHHLRGAKVVCARLQLMDETQQAADEKGVPVVPEWLPITIPVAEYAALVTTAPWDGRGTFRIAHSPTNRRFKGSDVYEDVIARLQFKGLPIERIDIMGMKHGDALRRKATCHACFDSFWLGMQGSGIEAGAMGIPVLAGDVNAAAAHTREVGIVPWTFTPDADALSEAIERLVTDVDFYAAEAARVSQFVRAYHDYTPVMRRYEGMLARWTGREDVHTEAPKPTRKRRKAA